MDNQENLKGVKLKKVLQQFILYVLLFIILIASYMGLMTLSSLIPASAIQENVKQSSETLLQDNEKKVYDLKYKQESIFTFTDALMINTAYSIDNHHPIESFLLARKNYVPGQTTRQHVDSQYNLGASDKYVNKANGDIYQTQELYGLMHGEQIEDSYEYARYWHGYLTILRPLLVMGNYEVIRVILLIVTFITIAIMLIFICKKINLTTAIAYGIGLLSISILVVSQSINEILIFLVAFISTIILLLKKDKQKNIGLFFFAVGSVSSFIDLLTAPLVTLGITAITYFLLLQKEEKNITIQKYLLNMVRIGIAWAIGYGLTWAAKWVITELFLGRPLISQAIEQAIYRTNVPTKSNGTVWFTIQDVIAKNLTFLSKPVILVTIAITVSYLIIQAIRNYKKQINWKENLKECVPYCFCLLLPFMWYFVLKQHSYIHAFFTYRILMIAIISIFMIATKILKKKEE